MSSATHNILVVVKQSGLDQVNSSLAQYNKTGTAAAATTDKMGTSMNAVKGKTTVLDGGLKSLDKSSKDATKSTTTLGSGMDTTGKKTEAVAGKFQKNKGMIFGLTMLTSGIIEAVGMFSMYSDATKKVSDAQDALQKIEAGGLKSTETYTKALAKRNAAQEKVNDLVTAGKTNTPQYTKAVAALKAAEAELAKVTEGGVKGTKEYQDASDDLADAQRGLRFVQRNMILSMTDLIPMTLMVVSGLIGLKTASTEAAAAQLAAGTATTKMTAASKLLRVALIALPFAAVAAGFLLIRNNTFGVRDALEGFGKKLGDTVPQLQGFLTWLHDLGEALGLTGKNLDFTKAWDLLVTGFQSAIKQIQETDWKGVFEHILKTTGDLIKNFNWADAWQSFKDALSDSATWLAPRIGEIGTYITNTIKSEGPKWWAGFQEALASTAQWLVTGIKAIGAGIISTIQTEGPSWWAGFQEALASTAQWVGKGITAIGAGIIKTIQTQGPTWWKGFQDALASTAQWVGKGITAIGTGITKTITAQGPTWWKGFQDALASTAQWVGKGIKAIGTGITSTIKTESPKWWKGFQDALGASVTWVKAQIKKIADAITGYDWASVGADIWKQITGAFGSVVDFLTGKGGGLQEVEGAGGKGVTLDQAHQMMGGGGAAGAAQKVDYDITPAISKLDQLKAYVNTTTTQISAMFLTMGQSIKLTLSQIPPAAQMAASQTSAAFITMEASIKGTILRIQTAFGTAFTPLPGLAMTATSQASAAFITMMTSIQGTFAMIATLFTTAFVGLPPAAMLATSQTSAAFITMLSSIQGTFTQITGQITTLQTAFEGLQTNVGTYMTAMINSITAWITTTLKQFDAFIKGGIITLQKAFSDLSKNIATYMTSMTGNTNKFVTAGTTGLGKVTTATTTLQSKISSMSSAFQSAMSAMSSKVNSFASACSSAFGKVGSSADAATKKVKALQSAINALKDKTITIHVNISGPGASYLQHGGSALNFGAPAHAQHGASWIQQSPRKIGNTHVAETFPELITAIPLDPRERNSPFNDINMDIPVPIINTASKQSNGGGPVTVRGDQYITIQIADGSVLAKAVRPYILQGYSGITSS